MASDVARLVDITFLDRYSFAEISVMVFSRTPHPPARRSPLAEVAQDVRFAFRSLTKDRAFALGVIGLLAAGLAANTAVFSLVDAYLLRSLPFPGAERLMRVSPYPRDAPRSVREAAPDGLSDIDWPARDELIEEIVTWELDVCTLLGAERPEVVPGAWVPAGYFRALDTTPLLGRLFTDDDSRAGAAPVAVLSHGLWMRRFGGAHDVLGRTLTTVSSDRPDDAESFNHRGRAAARALESSELEPGAAQRSETTRSDSLTSRASSTSSRNSRL